MIAREFIRRQVAGAWRVYDAVTSDLTEEQFNWAPPGTANPISATVAHIIGGADRFINAVIQGKPSLWESQKWSDKVGVGVTPTRGANWEPYLGTQFSLEPFKAYKAAVQASIDAYLETLTEADLDRKVLFHGEERIVGDMLALMVTHITQHSGDVSTLKGIQGAKGLPY